MAHFKTLEVTGTTYDAALENAPFNILGNATQAFKNFKKKQTGAITADVEKQFMMNYLQDKCKSTPGNGYYIVIEPAVVSDRKRPYEIENIKNDKGSRKFKRVYVGINENTGVEEFVCKTNKSDADAMLKEYYIMGGTDPIKVDVRMDCVEGVVTVLRGKYAPSKGSHPCVLKVFGIVNED